MFFLCIVYINVYLFIYHKFYPKWSILIPSKRDWERERVAEVSRAAVGKHRTANMRHSLHSIHQDLVWSSLMRMMMLIMMIMMMVMMVIIVVVVKMTAMIIWARLKSHFSAIARLAAAWPFWIPRAPATASIDLEVKMEKDWSRFGSRVCLDEIIFPILFLLIRCYVW